MRKNVMEPNCWKGLPPGDNNAYRTAFIEECVAFLRETTPQVFQLGVQTLMSPALAVYDSLDSDKDQA